MEPGTIEIRAAQFSARFVAYLLDTIPFAVGAAGTVWVMTGPLGKPPTPELLALIGATWITLVFGYQLIGNMYGGTIGKSLLGLRVIARDGGPTGFFRSLMRALIWLLGSTAGCFGFLIALFNRENRALHDYLSGTVVIETRPYSAAAGSVLFLVGAFAAIGLFGYQVYSGWAQPTPHDQAAIAKAEAGLAVIARVQEVYKETNGTYATSIDQLAQASGDPAEFQTAMAVLFQPAPFKMEAGNRGWRIRAHARDRNHTSVVREGP